MKRIVKIAAGLLVFILVLTNLSDIIITASANNSSSVSGGDAMVDATDELLGYVESEIVEGEEQIAGGSAVLKGTLEESVKTSDLAETEDMSTILEDIPEDILLKEQNALVTMYESGLEVGNKFSDNLFIYQVIATREVEIHLNNLQNEADKTVNIEIPDKVTYEDKEYMVTQIAEAAFEDCVNLTSIKIPDSVTYIAAYSFAGCSGLVSIDIPNTVRYIGAHAFEGCNHLASIDIPFGVEYINWCTFAGCSSLTNIDIPNSLSYIDTSSFEDCSSLVSIHIPNRVQFIGSNSFAGCSSLTSINIPDSVGTIYYSAFYGCSSLKNVHIPNQVEVIWGNTFEDCSSLTDVTIPDGVTTIGDSAFRNCISLESLAIPDNVLNIGSHAFEGCNKLVSIDVPKEIQSIYSAALDCDVDFIRFKGNVPTNECSADMFGIDGREIEIYYPIHNDTWTKEVKQKFVPYVNITWIPWDPETGEVFAPDGTNVPSDESFYFSNVSQYYVYEENLTFSLNGNFTAIQKGNVNEEADAIVWESSDPLVADIDHVLYVPDTGNIYLDDNAYSSAMFYLYIDCYKPGIVTITGTSVDGRIVTATMTLEPELNVKEEINVTNDTEITVCSFSIEEPNTDLLTAIISGLTIKCTSHQSPTFDERFEVAENGRTASVVWEIVPEFDGNFTFEVTSLAGQKKEIKMGVDIDRFNLGDVWSIDNYIVSSLPLTETYRTKLMAGMRVCEKAYMDFMLSNNYNGQCYGMAVTSLLIYKNVMQLNEIDENVARLYDARSNAQTRSIIGYYHLNQLTDAVIQNMKQFRKLSTKEQLERVCSSEFPVLLSFGHDSWGTHVVVGYEIEHGSFMAGGEVYDTMFKFYDSNEITTNGLGSYSALYFNEGTDQWTIPRYAAKGVSSADGGYLKDLCADTNILSDMRSSAFKLSSMLLRNMSGTSEITLYTGDQAYIISGGNFFIDGEIMTFYDDVDLLGDQEVTALNILLEEQTKCTIVPSAESSLDWGVVYADFFMNASADSYDSISFDKAGTIAATGLDGAYTMNLTMDESPLPWHTLEFNGSDATQFAVKLVKDGIQISGDNLNNITVYGINEEETRELTFSTDEDKVLLSEEDGELVIMQVLDENKPVNGDDSENSDDTGNGDDAGSGDNAGTGNNTGANTNAETGVSIGSGTDNNTSTNTNIHGNTNANIVAANSSVRDSVPKTGDSANIAMPLIIICILVLGVAFVQKVSKTSSNSN